MTAFEEVPATLYLRIREGAFNKFHEGTVRVTNSRPNPNPTEERPGGTTHDVPVVDTASLLAVALYQELERLIEGSETDEDLAAHKLWIRNLGSWITNLGAE